MRRTTLRGTDRRHKPAPPLRSRPAVAGLLAAAWLLAACGASEPSSPDPPDRAGSQLAAVRARGVLRMICFPHQNNPFIHVNLAMGPMPSVGGTDHFQGVDVDILAAFAKSLGVELEIHPVSEPSYAVLIPDLLAGRGDVVASSFSITEDRARQVSFSDPYFDNERSVIARADSPIASVEDLKGKVGAAIPGTTHYAFMQGLGLAPDHILSTAFTRENYTEVAEGRADFTCTDQGIDATLRKEFANLKIAFRIPGDDRYGIALPPGSDLLEPLNRFLARLKESGELQAIIGRHLNPAT